MSRTVTCEVFHCRRRRTGCCVSVHALTVTAQHLLLKGLLAVLLTTGRPVVKSQWQLSSLQCSQVHPASTCSFWIFCFSSIRAFPVRTGMDEQSPLVSCIDNHVHVQANEGIDAQPHRIQHCTGRCNDLASCGELSLCLSCYILPLARYARICSVILTPFLACAYARIFSVILRGALSPPQYATTL